MNYEILKQRHRSVRDNYPANLNLRVHRALSWLQRAELAEDDDSRFIFLWISFNAAYATQIDENSRLSEQATFRSFLEKLCDLDSGRQIDSLVWKEYSGSIRLLLDSPFVFQAFWDFHGGRISETEWSERFASETKKARKALAGGDTAILLSIVFSRLYTLRNQLLHGGATWNSAVNRSQLHDGRELLGKLIPLMIHLMLENPRTLWGDACYPVVDV